MENKEEIKGVNIANRELISIDNEIQELKQEPSPFKIYEERYCNTCNDYLGCIGLIDSITMSLQDSKATLGNESLDSLIKSMGGLTFTTRFKIILDCMELRNFISKLEMMYDSPVDYSK